jgi:hypothetical protein
VALAKELLRGLATALGADLQAAEPARILRLPGTLNYKYDPPREATVETFDASWRYSLKDLAAILPITADAPKPPAPPITGTIGAGSRNATLASLAGTMRKRGMSVDEITAALLAVNAERCRPPLNPDEVRRIAESVGRYDPGVTPQTPASPRIEIVEDLAAFLQRLESQPPLSWHIEGLIPDEGICLWHGQPRDFKSMCAQEVALALAAGRCAFGLARFAVRRPIKVCYFTEEDPERLFAARMHWLTHKNPMPAANYFFPFVRRGLSFDSAESRDFILSRIYETQAEASVFDPVRSYTGLSDKGPADLRPVALFVRQIQNETRSKTLLLVHHDTKPPAQAESDQRSRSQMASGGGIFSVSDCPVSFTKLAWNQVAVYPEDYKLSGNPRPFTVTFTSDVRNGEHGPCFGSWVLPLATTADEQQIVDATLAKKLLQFLRQHVGEWFSGDDIKEGAKIRGGSASPVLERLREEGLVKFCTGDAAKALGRSPKAKLWAAVSVPDVPVPDELFSDGQSPGESDRTRRSIRFTLPL